MRLLVQTLIVFSTSLALAHHHNGSDGRIGNLVQESRFLSQAVANTNIAYSVKSAVYRFGASVENLWRCVISQSANDNAERHHNDQVPAQCRYQFDTVRNAWSPVNYYLSDAWDFPAVYDSYRDTAEVLYAIP